MRNLAHEDITNGKERNTRKTRPKCIKKASKKQKGDILDAVCLVTGWSRDHARRQLHHFLSATRSFKPKKSRASKYSARAKVWLTNIWMLSGMTCGPYLYALVHAGLLNRLLRAEKLREGPGNKGRSLSPRIRRSWKSNKCPLLLWIAIWLIVPKTLNSRSFLFPILGINYDGGSEFINREMMDYATLQHDQAVVLDGQVISPQSLISNMTINTSHYHMAIMHSGLFKNCSPSPGTAKTAIRDLL